MEASSAQKFLELHKQRNDKTLCDVTLSIEDEKFHCHRNVLAAGSQYFTTMFQGDFVERRKDDIQLKNFDKTLFSIFLDLAYTGKTTLFNTDNITDMLIMASMLMSELLEKAAVDFMKHSICMSNVINYFELSTNHRLTFLSGCCVDYLCDNFTEILKNNNIFLDLPIKILLDVLQEVELNEVDIDEKMYTESLLRWLKFDPERLKYAEQLIKTIRFEHIDGLSLLTEISDNKELFQLVQKYGGKNKNARNTLRFIQVGFHITEHSKNITRHIMRLEMFSYSRNLYKKKTDLSISVGSVQTEIEAAILNERLYLWFGVDDLSNFIYWDLSPSSTKRLGKLKLQSEYLVSMIGINEKNKIYASPGDPGLHPLYYYDAVTDNWHGIDIKQNNGIYGQGLVNSIDNNSNVIYRCGGLITVDGNEIQQPDITVYDDRDQNRFQNVGKLVCGIDYCEATILNNSIYVIDKYHSDRKPELIVQRFDINAGKAELLRSPIQCNRIGIHHHCLATFNGKIWATNPVQYYDEKRNIWKRKNWNIFDENDYNFIFGT